MNYWKNKSVLVTGGAGLLGSHVVDILIGEGACCVTLDNLSSGNRKNFEHHTNKRQQFSFVNCDVADDRGVLRTMQHYEVTHVFHLAASMHVSASVKNPADDYNTNNLGTATVLEASRLCKVQKFVYASSCAVYGGCRKPLLSEEDACPTSPYGANKLASEVLGLTYRRCYGLPFTAVRLFSLFGPRMQQTVLYDLLMKLNRNPKRLDIWGTGKPIRDFTPVSHAAGVLVGCAMSAYFDGHVFNYSGYTKRSILEIVDGLLDVLGLAGKTEVVPDNAVVPGEIDSLCSDNRLFEQLFEDEMLDGSSHSQWDERAYLLDYCWWLDNNLGTDLLKAKDRV